jgi:hypothetical protein
MDERRVAEAVGRALSQDGFSVEEATIDAAPVLVARRAFFRWRWFATRIEVFVTSLGCTVGGVAEAQRKLDGVFQYSLAHKTGLPRGFQNGVGNVAVIPVQRLDPSLRTWAEGGVRRVFAGVAFPVVADVSTGEAAFSDKGVFMGSQYAGFLRNLVKERILPAITRPAFSPTDTPGDP